MKLNKKKKGFTLIELMAVIAIVAILAAVLVPTV
ncbi:MAG: prepilin-type N-terminal cleavage/methylation domain-containing protein, partial [Clostridium celatum]|nr:prepilin-type N-terminal cleavage/methylation domain-containing protein [Clostridium celatum]